jgi:acyl carrier protein
MLLKLLLNYKIMKKIKLGDVRSALVALEFLTQEECDELSDQELLKQRFLEDLELDSLDLILLLERLEGANELSLVDVDIWDCKCVKDLIDMLA